MLRTALLKKLIIPLLAATFFAKMTIPDGRTAEIYVDHSDGSVFYDFGHGHWWLKYVEYKNGNFTVNGSPISKSELAHRIQKDWDAR